MLHSSEAASGAEETQRISERKVVEVALKLERQWQIHRNNGPTSTPPISRIAGSGSIVGIELTKSVSR